MRGFMLAVLLSMLAVCLPTMLLAQDQPVDEAEKLFRGMEEKLAKAGTVEMAFEGEFKGRDDAKWKGTLVLAGKNNVRIAFDGETLDGRGKYLIVADGTNLRFSRPKGKPETTKCPGKITENLLRTLARSTTWPMRLILPCDAEGEKELDKLYAVSAFKFKGKEKLGKQETNVVTYKVDFEVAQATVTLWIDAQSQLPSKRILEGSKDHLQMVEHYRDWKLGAKIDAKLFKVAE